ncbi:MAG: hypothetical protein OK436_04255 [Thaumarchaeota archaeon]|nr:hypothetical protein [Nitrososphaerota archaeon]
MQSKLSVEDVANMIRDHVGGIGFKELGPNYGIDESNAYRNVLDGVGLVKTYFDVGLVGSKLLSVDRTFPLKFGNRWQADGKVIRVAEYFTRYNEVFSTRTFPDGKGGEVIKYDLYSENIVDTLTHTAFTAMYLPTNKTQYLLKPFLTAERIAGTPTVVEVDTMGYVPTIQRLWVGHVVLVVKPRVGERSQNYIVEGFNKFLDRKADFSIHGATPWELDELRIHYNGVSRKRTLRDLTPWEYAGFPRMNERNPWLTFMNLALQYERRYPDLFVRPWRFSNWSSPTTLD